MILAFIGTTELLLIGGLALLLFGGKKLPEMMRGLGKGVKEFKSGLNDPLTPEPEVPADGEEVAKNLATAEEQPDSEKLENDQK